MLTGLAANLEFQKKITWLAINHSPEIVQLDTVLAHHYGINFLVEVHIVLPPEMSVRQAHDIQESLQSRLESLEEVERAFVHIDYEAEHDPQMEHKMLWISSNNLFRIEKWRICGISGVSLIDMD